METYTEMEARLKPMADACSQGDYYADGNAVREHGTGAVIAIVANHSEAVSVMLQIARRSSRP